MNKLASFKPSHQTSLPKLTHSSRYERTIREIITRLGFTFESWPRKEGLIDHDWLVVPATIDDLDPPTDAETSTLVRALRQELGDEVIFTQSEHAIYIDFL